MGGEMERGRRGPVFLAKSGLKASNRGRIASRGGLSCYTLQPFRNGPSRAAKRGVQTAYFALVTATKS